MNPSKYRKDWPVTEHKQGAACSEEEAKKKVESFWNPISTVENPIKKESHAAS